MASVLTRVGEWINPSKVYLVGPAGAGKSTFVRWLQEEPVHSPLDITTRPTGVQTTKITIARQTFKLVCIPEEALAQPTIEGVPSGIIVLSAFGYYTTKATSEPSLSKEKVLDIVSSQRDSELSFLDEQFADLLSSIDRDFSASNAVDWVMNVVNKADLWWNEKQSVEQFYNGPFRRKMLASMRSFRATERAMPITKFLACRTQAFSKSVRVASSFDDSDRAKLHKELTHSLAEAALHSENG